MLAKQNVLYTLQNEVFSKQNALQNEVFSKQNDLQNGMFS